MKAEEKPHLRIKHDKVHVSIVDRAAKASGRARVARGNKL